MANIILAYLIGVEQSHREALKYFKMAADQGHADASEELNNLMEMQNEK